tara:strand:- start:50 stop:1180 length:1131 start_codon:yes stop_codon:yes gene_type:complete
MDKQRQMILDCIKDGGDQFLERSLVINHAWAALLGGHHVWLYGPPGEGKSAAIRFICDQIKGSDYFEYLFSKFSQPKSVFGPLKISKLKQDIEEYDVNGYLPTAHVAMLDEGGRASGAIRETLLTVINERKFKNGKNILDCPLMSLFSGSNSLLENEEDEAFRDRFLVTVHVTTLQDDKNFMALLDKANPSPKTSITLKQLQAVQADVAKISMSDAFKESMRDVRRSLAKEGITASTRRWISIARGLRAFAWLEGDSELLPDHIEWASDMLWMTIEERRRILRIVGNVVNPDMARAVALQDKAISLANDVPKNVNDSEFYPKLGTANKHIGNILEEVESLLNRNSNKKATRIKAIHEEICNLRDKLLADTSKAMGM